MNTWFEIFKTGTHTASSGATRSWSEADLDKMVAGYNAADNPAPLVVGHPKTNAPAYGWVEQLKRVGDRLLALPRQVEESFSNMVKEGRFPKRSISVNPDGTLRHVGFLGAVPPAVKGLKDVEFAADEMEVYEYAGGQDMPTIEELQAKLAEEQQKRAAAEAKYNEEKQRADQVSADFAAARVQAGQKEIADFIATGIDKGTILPAWKDKGLAEFMGELEKEESFEFAEGKKQTPAEWFKSFISDFAAHPLFREMARPAGDTTRGDDFAADEQQAEEMAASHRVK